jgi:hypothetical protein
MRSLFLSTYRLCVPLHEIRSGLHLRSHSLRSKNHFKASPLWLLLPVLKQSPLEFRLAIVRNKAHKKSVNSVTWKILERQLDLDLY